MRISFSNIFSFSLVLLLIHGTMSIRELYLQVPDSAQFRGKVEMRCLFQLEINEMLYSVKWYRGAIEFCRYLLRDVPPLKVFNNIPGITVIESESDAHRITLDPVTDVANGWYTCEVSADAPSFQTHQMTAFMNVIDQPAEGPEVRGLKLRYKLGMTLKAECVIRNSLPAANLSFFINSEPALSQHVWRRVEENGTSELGQLWDSYITIQFTIQRHHVKDEKLKLRCTAFIYSLYTKSREKCVLVDMPATTTAAPTTSATTPRYTWWRPRERVVHLQRRRPAAELKSDASNMTPVVMGTVQLLTCLLTVLLLIITT